MTDKVQKIREEVERIQLYTQSEVLKQVLDYIDKVQKEPVSEPNKELAETYLAVFNKKFPILPSLSGKQLADYKNFLNKCQQIFDLKEWGIRPIQSKLFEKLTLLWAAWGAEHLQGVGRQDEKEQDIPVREELEEASRNYADNEEYGDDVYYAVKAAFKAGANWQKEQEYTCYEEAFEDGAKWKAEQFEKNRLKHCDSITNEQAELEQGFIDQHLDKYQRMPTFLDAIEYGMRLQKEKMMKDAIDAKIGSFTNGTIYDADFNIDSNLKDSDKVKVIVIKED